MQPHASDNAPYLIAYYAIRHIVSNVIKKKASISGLLYVKHLKLQTVECTCKVSVTNAELGTNLIKIEANVSRNVTLRTAMTASYMSLKIVCYAWRDTH